MSDFDEMNNMVLIEDGLRHLVFELDQNRPNFHRIAKEAYTVLYKSMIEVLRGTANLEVTGKHPKNRKHTYLLGRGPWKTIQKVKIEGCDVAWRFSEPKECDPPDNIDTTPTDIHNRLDADRLISFFDALAMIQTELFMEKYTFSKKSLISDYDMRALEILHIEIRNNFEHTIPMSRLTSIGNLLYMSMRALEISNELLFESGNVIFHRGNREELKAQMDNSLRIVKRLIKKREKL